MNYKELSKENGIGYSYWLENIKVLFEDFELSLPDSKDLGMKYHQGNTVWEVFAEQKTKTNLTSF